MTPLETAARALYGVNWQVPLARVLGVADRTVRRWHSGESPVPSGIWGELKPLLLAHSAECRRIARTLG